MLEVFNELSVGNYRLFCCFLINHLSLLKDSWNKRFSRALSKVIKIRTLFAHQPLHLLRTSDWFRFWDMLCTSPGIIPITVLRIQFRLKRNHDTIGMEIGNLLKHSVQSFVPTSWVLRSPENPKFTKENKTIPRHSSDTLVVRTAADRLTLGLSCGRWCRKSHFVEMMAEDFCLHRRRFVAFFGLFSLIHLTLKKLLQSGSHAWFWADGLI